MMRAAEIRAVLKPLGILVGMNLHPDEPTPGQHIVAVKHGTKAQARRALEAAGAVCWPAYCSEVYAEYICVERTRK